MELCLVRYDDGHTELVSEAEEHAEETCQVHLAGAEFASSAVVRSV